VADGHVLLDDLPGVAKTLTARSLARVTGVVLADPVHP
jgi:MoxR-like ATPase